MNGEPRATAALGDQDDWSVSPSKMLMIVMIMIMMVLGR